MAYVELHCHSAYSFLDGASSPEELAAAAAELGYPALALTDHDGLWGSMEFAHACRGLGMRAITGAELTVAPGPYAPPPSPLPREGPPPGCFHVTLLAEDRAGYRNLCRLITEAHRHTRPKPGGEPLPPAVPLELLERHAEGLVCLSGCARHGALAGGWQRGDPRGAEALGRTLLRAFGRERFRVELQRPLWRRDQARNRWLATLAERLAVPCVASGGVHAHAPGRAALQDALVAVRLRRTLDETEPERRGNAASVLASPGEMAERFRDHPEAVAEADLLAERLAFDLTRDLGYRYPGSEDPDADRRLAEICRSRLEERYGSSTSRGSSDASPTERAEAERRLEEELGVIRSLGLAGFFLLHRDLLELAREVAREVRGPDSARGLLPPGRGRGSSVSSIVCYLTGLSHVDPVRGGLFLGRFLNEEIVEVPDIDLDFPRDIRDVLIPRVHERYGPERSGLVAAFACYRSRGAIRDLGKALGLPAGELERVARAVDVHGGRDSVERDLAEALGGARAGSVRWRALVELAREAWGLPRHLSQHPGGMVLSTRPLIELCPVQPAAMEGRQTVQWDKDSCADAGFLKIDLLGLGMLSAVERCVDEIARVRGERLDLSRIPLDDPRVYRAIQAADTTGSFQIESRAQMQMLVRTRPENLDDLTVQVALVRPGPIQGGAVHPYIERRRRLREDPSFRVPYEHPSLEPILRDTLGAIVFQEQVIQVAMALAGFGSGEAEGLRRAMSRKRSEEAINAYRERFLAGARARGVPGHVARRVFGQIRGFSGFGFPKAHAAAFALLAYQSSWLRAHFAPEFLCALLNEQPMGFYPPDALAHEAQRRGIAVLAPDVNHSNANCHVERVRGDGQPPSLAVPASGRTVSPERVARECAKRSGDRPSPLCCSPAQYAVRIGLGYVNGMREEEMNRLVAERERGGSYVDLADLASRSGIGRESLERLAWAGACAGPRRDDLWRSGVAAGSRRSHDGDQLALPLEVPASPPLRELGEWERMVADYASIGMTLRDHPMALLRAELGDGVASSEELARITDGARVAVAGLVVARQRPATARGVVFMLLEDEWGTINVIVPPPVYERHRVAVRTAGFVRAEGRVERREGTLNVVAGRIGPLACPDLPAAEVRHIEPPVEQGGFAPSAPLRRASPTGRAVSDLDAVLPAAHSFGRRGR